MQTRESAAAHALVRAEVPNSRRQVNGGWLRLPRRTAGRQEAVAQGVPTLEEASTTAEAGDDGPPGLSAHAATASSRPHALTSTHAAHQIPHTFSACIADSEPEEAGWCAAVPERLVARAKVALW